MYKLFGVFAILALLSACQCNYKDGRCVPDDVESITAEGYQPVELHNVVSTTTQELGTTFPEEDRTYYATNKYNLTPEAQRILAAQAEWLQNNPGVRVIIEGHCDERGTREYNLALGERRANGVKDYLVSLGIDPNRLETISYGKDRPVYPGSTPEAWAKNRVSITVVQ